MSTVEYKGYQATVTYEDGTLRIQVLHVSDFISADCDEARNVQKVFHELIDEYLADCAAEGVEPDKPFKGSFNVRMTPGAHRQAVMASRRKNQSLNAWVVDAVEAKLEAESVSTDVRSDFWIRRITDSEKRSL